MALWADRLAKLAQALGLSGSVPETSISTAETDTTLRLAPDGAGGVEWGTGGGGTGRLVSRTQSVVSDECFFRVSVNDYMGGVSTTLSGTGTSVTAGAGEAGHPGILILNLGTQSAVGRVGMISGTPIGLIPDDAVVRFGVVFRILNLSDGTDRYTVRIGLGDLATAEPVDGIYFRYADNVNGGEWEGVCRANSVETVLDTNIAANTSWHTFEAEVNLATTSVEYFIDGTSAGTVTTNIPQGAGRETTLMPVAVIKSLGTTARLFHIDAYWYHFDFTPSR